MAEILELSRPLLLFAAVSAVVLATASPPAAAAVSGVFAMPF
jgi:hypothetical protein